MMEISTQWKNKKKDKIDFFLWLLQIERELGKKLLLTYASHLRATFSKLALLHSSLDQCIPISKFYVLQCVPEKKNKVCYILLLLENREREIERDKG